MLLLNKSQPSIWIWNDLSPPIKFWLQEEVWIGDGAVVKVINHMGLLTLGWYRVAGRLCWRMEGGDINVGRWQVVFVFGG